jgi:hypothetical protein
LPPINFPSAPAPRLLAARSVECLFQAIVDENEAWETAQELVAQAHHQTEAGLALRLWLVEEATAWANAAPNSISCPFWLLMPVSHHGG